jgi:molybdopterin-containing oxidoreductase family membrane subunit
VVLIVSAILLTVTIPVRAVFGLHDHITWRHLDFMCRIMAVCGVVVGYVYAMEMFMMYYSASAVASPYAADAVMLRVGHGPSAWIYYALFFCNGLAPQLFWFKGVRRNVWTVLAVSIAVILGMLSERYVISLGVGSGGDL